MRKYYIVLMCFVSVFFASDLSAQTPQKSISNLSELSQEIERIRIQNNTPGMAIGIVQSGQADWQYFSGMANLEERRPVNAQSQFRFGSISKMLIALSILKLEEEGKLNLQSTLQAIAPEIAFTNPWEARHPLRIIHLLNHSSGWDAPHLKEHISLDDKPVSIEEVLTIYPESRVSRWAPGSRVAYNNTGFLVAAYVVEKLSGKAFESYVKETFFDGLSMSSSAYYFSEAYRESAVSLYLNNKVQPYRHLNHRAVGGLNSTLGDMLNFASLLSKQDQAQVVSQSVLKTLRTPSGSNSAALGVEFNWGLGNQIFHANGQVLYGHEGSVRGGSAILVYSPEHQFAYVIASNDNSPSVMQTHRLLSLYLSKGYSANTVAPERNIKAEDTALSGWYKNASPVSQKFAFASTILPWRLHISEQKSFIKPLLGAPPRTLIADKNKGFKQSSTGLRVLVPAETKGLEDGIYYGPQTFVKTSAIGAFTPLLVITAWGLMSFSSLLFMLIWLPRYAIKKSISKAAITYRFWPLLSLMLALLTLFCIQLMVSSVNMHKLGGTVSVLSVLIFLGSLSFFVSTIWTLWQCYIKRNIQMNAFSKWHSILFAFVNFGLALLLMVNGLIGIRLWA